MDLDPGTSPDVDSEADTEVDTDAVVCAETLRLSDGQGGCRAVQVFLLDDAGPVSANRGGARSSGPAVTAALEQAVDGVDAFVVTNGGYAPQVWDGTIPVNTDVVFWAQGVDYTSELDDTRLAALRAFVAGGGGLVRTEWGTGYQQLYPDLAPVASEDRDYFEGVVTWSIADSVPTALAPVVAQLPETFTLSHGFTNVQADSGAVVLATVPFDDDSNEETPDIDVPALVVQPSSRDGGTVAFVNHDLLYVTTSMTEPEMAPLLQGVTYAAAAGL